MIRDVYVNGYRSLESITVPLRPGVNILVGPNGGGKTNILSFFEFISKLITLPVDEAVSSHGGIGRVFCRLPDNLFKNTLDVRLSGSITFRTKQGLRKELWYTWEFEISSSETYDEISYSSQKLFINMDRKPVTLAKSDLVLSTKFDDGAANLKVENMIISRLQSFFRSMAFVDASEYYDWISAYRLLTRYGIFQDIAKQCIINIFPPQMTILRAIIQDIRGAEIFNIVPDICKQPDNSARPR